MPKFMVQAVSRPGYDGSWRAGRKWPSSGPTEVELVDGDADPEHDPAKGIRLGKKSFDALKADPNLVVRQPGDPVQNAQTAEQLLQDNERLKAEIAALRGQGQATADGGEHSERRKRG
jgi:hypothetical protein